MSETKVFKANRKKVIEGRDKPLWVPVGFTMLATRRDGEVRYTLIDERSGDSYALFEDKPREKRENSDDSVPF